MTKAGSDGGKATLRRYGVAHFRELGKKGIQGLAAKYFQGSISDAMEWLRRRGYEHKMAAGVDAKLDARLAAGESVVCEELPVVAEPDLDPSFWQDKVRDHNGVEIDLPF